MCSPRMTRQNAVPNFAVNLSQRFIINPTKEINFEPWGIGGLNRGRSETGIRFSYQF